jgi:predicted dithiol-disulfide oxidoreductase (DUF899 family)
MPAAKSRTKVAARKVAKKPARASVSTRASARAKSASSTKIAKETSTKTAPVSQSVSWTRIAAQFKKVTAANAALLKVTRESFGQVVSGDLVFDTLHGPVTLAQLFGDKSDLLIIHNMGKSCVYCTTWADGFAGLVPHITDRTSLALSSPDSPTVQKEFADSRNWPYRMLSVPSGGFAHAMGFEPPPGKFHPGVSAFHKDASGVITRTGASHFGPGDGFCALWPMLDLLKGGVGTWAPKYTYKSSQSCGSCCNCS